MSRLTAKRTTSPKKSRSTSPIHGRGEGLVALGHGKQVQRHPDEVIGKGLSASFIEQAKMQMQKINNAYEAICKSRGIHS